MPATVGKTVVFDSQVALASNASVGSTNETDAALFTFPKPEGAPFFKVIGVRKF